MSRRPNSATTRVDGGGDLVEVGDVHRHADARRPIAAISCSRSAALGRITQAESDVGAGVGEGQRDGSADAPRRPGDQRRAPVESEAGNPPVIRLPSEILPLFG